MVNRVSSSEGGGGEVSPSKHPASPPKGKREKEKRGKGEREKERKRERGGGGRGACIFRHGTSDQYSSLLHDLII